MKLLPKLASRVARGVLFGLLALSCDLAQACMECGQEPCLYTDHANTVQVDPPVHVLIRDVWGLIHGFVNQPSPLIDQVYQPGIERLLRRRNPQRQRPCDP